MLEEYLLSNYPTHHLNGVLKDGKLIPNSNLLIPLLINDRYSTLKTLFELNEGHPLFDEKDDRLVEPDYFNDDNMTLALFIHSNPKYLKFISYYVEGERQMGVFLKSYFKYQIGDKNVGNKIKYYGDYFEEINSTFINYHEVKESLGLTYHNNKCLTMMDLEGNENVFIYFTFLSQLDFDYNSQDSKGNTLLHYLSKYISRYCYDEEYDDDEGFELVNNFIVGEIGDNFVYQNSNINPNIVNNKGETPLFVQTLPSEYDDPSISEALMLLGCNPSIKNNKGELFYLKDFFNLDNIQNFIDNGIDLNAVNETDGTRLINLLVFHYNFRVFGGNEGDRAYDIIFKNNFNCNVKTTKHDHDHNHNIKLGVDIILYAETPAMVQYMIDHGANMFAYHPSIGNILNNGLKYTFDDSETVTNWVEQGVDVFERHSKLFQKFPQFGRTFSLAYYSLRCIRIRGIDMSGVPPVLQKVSLI